MTFKMNILDEEKDCNSFHLSSVNEKRNYWPMLTFSTIFLFGAHFGEASKSKQI